jgi:hypothetical protein
VDPPSRSFYILKYADKRPTAACRIKGRPLPPTVHVDRAEILTVAVSVSEIPVPVDLETTAHLIRELTDGGLEFLDCPWVIKEDTVG